jgi:hypothetical protein
MNVAQVILLLVDVHVFVLLTTDNYFETTLTILKIKEGFFLELCFKILTLILITVFYAIFPTSPPLILKLLL